MDSYQKFIAVSRYARFIPDEGRRETWSETVGRYVRFWMDRGVLDEGTADDLFDAIVNLEVMPSMRCMMTAGEALDRDNVAAFNCSYVCVDHPRAFDEAMYILMCGTGVGYTVERQDIAKLPEVAEKFFPTDTTIVVPDSKKGWAKSFRQLLSLLWAGEVPNWDVSKVRPAGAPLKTFGGRASGPEPLVRLFKYAIDLFKGAAGRKLTDLEASDLMCKVGEVVVVGGVRRSALICLSNPSSTRMRDAKSGEWWHTNGQRALANMSACYTDRPEFNFFLDEMRALYRSKSGERGIFNRVACDNIVGRNGRREQGWAWGTNPCSEIILRPNQFCNLSEVVVRDGDTLEDLKRKVRVATILGTLQATLTDFSYLRSVWKRNTEEEALLGVSLTGIEDHKVLSGRGLVCNADDSAPGEHLHEWLTAMREEAITTNKAWAAKLGINQSAAITCVKPSGTVSQLVNSASGIHPRFAPYYIRTVRQDLKDPLTQYMMDAGVPWEQDERNPMAAVFSFPQKAPESSVFASEVGAIGQLELWKQYQLNWCEHKPSITVYYRDSEFFAVCQWMWDNFDLISGIALLPYDDHNYPQAPYQRITQDEYEAWLAVMPDIDFDEYREGVDNTIGMQTLACVGSTCELP